MQTMLTAFITTNTRNSGTPSAKANPISRTFPPLFTIKLPEEEQIIDELQEIKSMQLVVQVIMIIVSILIAFIVLYYCCKKCRHMCTMFKYCFLFLPISRILKTSRRTDLFVEVTNLTKGILYGCTLQKQGIFPQIFTYPDPYQKKMSRSKLAVAYLNE